MQGAGLNGHALKSMKDFARQIAAREKCPSFAFSCKPLDPTVLVHLSLLKTLKFRETLEIFALRLYRCGHDHDSFRDRFPAPVPPTANEIDQIRTAD